MPWGRGWLRSIHFTGHWLAYRREFRGVLEQLFRSEAKKSDILRTSHIANWQFHLETWEIMGTNIITEKAVASRNIGMKLVDRGMSQNLTTHRFEPLTELASFPVFWVNALEQTCSALSVRFG